MHNIKLKLVFSLSFALIIFFSCNTNAQYNLVNFPNEDPALSSLRSAFSYFHEDKVSFWEEYFHFRDTFYKKGFDFTIQIKEDRPKLHYHLWMQKKPAPIIAIVPGLGGGYLNPTPSLLAKKLYKEGYSVFVISNPFNWNFIEAASTTMLPGFTPQDSKDLYVALYKILYHLKEKYKERIQERLLVGYSLGGLDSLALSSLDQKYKLVDFSRILAINPPVDLSYGIQKLDSFYQLGQSWTTKQKLSKLTEGVKYYGKLKEGKINKREELPFSSKEAKFILGHVFHEILVNTIYTIKKNKNFGILHHKYNWFNRTALYKEIGTYTFYEYINKFIFSYYSKKLNTDITEEELNKIASLPAYEESLKDNPKVRVIHNRDDFLIKEEDAKWLKETFKERLVTLDKGGHLGNILFPKFFKIMLKGLNLEKNKF